ncbi:MAG: hypothetical protein ACW981_06770 [Candidatus Hodarchaeales archaeon]|jgi:hypothetical protein
MKSKSLPLLVFISLMIFFNPLITDQGFSTTDINELSIDFTINGIYSSAQSPIDQIVQIEHFGSNSLPNVVVSSKYQVFGLNSETSIIHWSITLEENKSIIISDMQPEPTEENFFPSNFYLSLSNGTLIKINKQGDIIWAQFINNGNFCSSTNCSRSISFLYNKLGIITDYDIVLGGSDSNLYYLLQNGSMINNFLINSSITIIKTSYPYTIIGSSLGNVYAYNYTDNLLWSQNISSSNPVISIGVMEDFILANAWSENPVTLSLTTGIQIVDVLSLEDEIITYDSINVQENVEHFYVSLLFGRIGQYDFAGIQEWIVNLDSNLLTNVKPGNVTGSSSYEIIVTTDVGTLVVLNSSSGSILDELTVYNEMISHLTITDLNSDGLDDIFIGSVLGSLAVIYGEDFIPPRFSTELRYVLTDNNILELYALTNEPATSILVIKSEDGVQTILENDTLRLNQSFTEIELDEDIEYTLSLTIYDANTNSAISPEILIKTKIIPKIPWDLYFIGLLVGVIGLAGVYFILSFVLRIRYNNHANVALGLGDYAKAIKLFYKGKNQEKIIETVRVIMNNPELASKMNEIAQAAELEDYISEIHDLIVHEG